MSKIKILSPSDIQASKGTNGTITLFLNKNTNTVCYKDINGKIIQVGIEKLEEGAGKEAGAARP
jgi:hypothetical protein